MLGKRAIGLICVLVAIGLTVSFFAGAYSQSTDSPKSYSPDVLFGVDAAFGTVEDMEAIIGQVKSYTNFFVIGSTAITNDLSNITQVCNYLNESGLKFSTYSHPAPNLPFSQVQWVADARKAWRSNFVGLYAYDEPGGHQIDHDYQYMSAQEAANYSDAAKLYVENLTWFLSGIKPGWEIGDFPIFTSDYALFDYDFRAGYDAIFTEFTGNLNRNLGVGLCRGAATLRGKDWGVMITANATAGTIESGQKMFDDLILAYQNGAKYILVFDYPSLATGILRQEHFDALKNFWHYMQENPRKIDKASERTAYVLPKDYGYGFRGSADKIWGLWEADNASYPIWADVIKFSQMYGNKLDIVYEDTLQLSPNMYSQLIFWNGTTLTS